MLEIIGSSFREKTNKFKVFSGRRKIESKTGVFEETRQPVAQRLANGAKTKSELPMHVELHIISRRSLGFHNTIRMASRNIQLLFVGESKISLVRL